MEFGVLGSNMETWKTGWIACMESGRLLNIRKKINLMMEWDEMKGGKLIRDME